MQIHSSSSSGTNGLPLTFQSDGSRKYVELLVVNLQASAEHGGKHWEEIGTWYISGEISNLNLVIVLFGHLIHLHIVPALKG